MVEAEGCRMTLDWTKLAADLERLLRLRAIPFGMKLFERRSDMEAVPRIRRPKAVHTLDQIVAQAARLGWTVAITSEDLVGAQCRAVVGLGLAKRSGQHMVGVWYAAPEDARAHQSAMECVPDARYQALAVAPLASGQLDPPDIALFYATPGAMMYFINGLQWSGYKRFDWSLVGESACADSWGRALKTRQPSLSIPCFAERRYGGGTRRRNADGIAARRNPKSHRRNGSARQERAALPFPAIRHPAGRLRRYGGKLSRARRLTARTQATAILIDLRLRSASGARRCDGVRLGLACAALGGVRSPSETVPSSRLSRSTTGSRRTHQSRIFINTL